MPQAIPILLSSLLLLTAGQLASTQASTRLAKTCTEEDLLRGPARGAVCGPRLANLLGTICGRNGYYTGRADRELKTSYEEEEHLVPFISVHKVKAYVRTKNWDSSGWTGVVCDCCYNRCGYRRLLRYCNTPSNRISPYVKTSNSRTVIEHPVRSHGSAGWLASGKRIVHVFSGDSRTTSRPTMETQND